MNKLFFLVISVLLGISVLRLTLGDDEPMTLTRFLSALSNVDISFENTLQQIADLRNALIFTEMDSAGFLDAIGLFLTWFYNLFKNLLMVPIEIIHDFLDFLASVLQFFQVLIT